MNNTTIKELSETLKLNYLELLKQFNEIGIEKKKLSDAVTDEEKNKLIEHLQKINKPKTTKKLTLSRNKTQTSTLSGVKIETRKKRKVVIPPPSEIIKKSSLSEIKTDDKQIISSDEMEEKKGKKNN